VSVHLHASALLHLLDLHEIIYWNTSVRTGWENPNLIKIRHFTWKSNYIAWLLAILNCHKSTLSNWNGVRLLVCPSVSMYQGGCYWMDVCEIWYWGLQWKSFKKFQIWLKSGTSHINLCTLHYCQQYLNLHESAVFEWNGIMLLGWLRRYKWSAGTVPAVMQY